MSIHLAQQVKALEAVVADQKQAIESLTRRVKELEGQRRTLSTKPAAA